MRHLVALALFVCLGTAAPAQSQSDIDYLSGECADASFIACAALGNEYEKNDRFADAAIYYGLGCDLHPSICMFLGKLFAQGKGVEQDDARAFALFKRSCDDGNEIQGCAFTGWFLATGRGVEMDIETARKYLRNSCQREHARSCEQLSKI